MDDNIIMLTDGYKPSHWKMDPPGTEFKHFYFESRGGEFKEAARVGRLSCAWTQVTQSTKSWAR